jgi:hypothetical protein
MDTIKPILPLNEQRAQELLSECGELLQDSGKTRLGSPVLTGERGVHRVRLILAPSGILFYYNGEYVGDFSSGIVPLLVRLLLNQGNPEGS